MKRAAKKSTLIQEFARKVGYAAGRVVATTQELADNAAAMVSHEEVRTTQAARASSPAARTPRKHSPRRAVNKKKASSSSATPRSKSKKSAATKKPTGAKTSARKTPKRSAASRH